MELGNEACGAVPSVACSCIGKVCTINLAMPLERGRTDMEARWFGNCRSMKGSPTLKQG